MNHEVLNQIAGERAQALLIDAKTDSHEDVYVAMMTHLIAFVGLAKGHQVSLESQYVLIERLNEVTQVFDLNGAGHG